MTAVRRSGSAEKACTEGYAPVLAARGVRNREMRESGRRQEVTIGSSPLG